MHEDVWVYFVQIPGNVNEMVCPCDGGYNIAIDPRQSDAGIKRSYRHALKHIHRRDWEKDDVQQIEHDAHERG